MAMSRSGECDSSSATGCRARSSSTTSVAPASRGGCEARGGPSSSANAATQVETRSPRVTDRRAGTGATDPILLVPRTSGRAGNLVRPRPRPASGPLASQVGRPASGARRQVPRSRARRDEDQQRDRHPRIQRICPGCTTGSLKSSSCNITISETRNFASLPSAVAITSTPLLAAEMAAATPAIEPGTSYDLATPRRLTAVMRATCYTNGNRRPRVVLPHRASSWHA
jgi:hypothetical protein